METINKEIASVGEYMLMLAQTSGNYVDFGFNANGEDYVLMVRKVEAPVDDAGESTEEASRENQETTYQGVS